MWAQLGLNAVVLNGTPGRPLSSSPSAPVWKWFFFFFFSGRVTFRADGSIDVAAAAVAAAAAVVAAAAAVAALLHTFIPPDVRLQEEEEEKTDSLRDQTRQGSPLPLPPLLFFFSSMILFSRRVLRLE